LADDKREWPPRGLLDAHSTHSLFFLKILSIVALDRLVDLLGNVVVRTRLGGELFAEDYLVRSPRLGLPEPGAQERLGAVEEALLDVHPDGELGPRSSCGKSLAYRGIGGEIRSSVPAQRLIGAGDNEDDAGVRIVQDIEVAERELVAGALRDEQSPGVLDGDKPGMIALGGRILVAPTIRSGKHDEQERLMKSLVISLSSLTTLSWTMGCGLPMIARSGSSVVIVRSLIVLLASRAFARSL
jgi:hypothetical protein